MSIIPMRRIRFLFWVVRELTGKYKRSLLIGFLIGLAVAFAIGRFSITLSSQLFTKTVRVGIIGEFTPTTLPIKIQQKISNGLTQLSADGSPQASLALSWESTESGRLFLFHLRDGLTWHNEKSVSAKDINYNIRGATLNPIDERTLEVHLSTAYSPFPVLVAKPIFQAGLRGFGPYKVSAIRLKGDKVDYIKLVPFKDDTLPVTEYRFYRTEALATLAYKRGDVDILEDMSSAQALSQWGQTTVIEETNFQRIVTLFFNQKKQLLMEKGIRQALGYAVGELPGERAYSPFSKLSWAYTDKVKKYDSDIVQAKKLFSASNVGSQSATLTLSTFPSYLEVANSIAQSWTDLGLPTTVRVISSVTDDYDVLLSAAELPPDPDQYPFWHSTQTQTNITSYVNVKIDKLLEDGRQETDPEKRKLIYGDFQRRLTDDAPAIFLYHPKTYTIKRGK
ncbi:hypothetical protein A3A79_00145 [Candidatus Gottesmanbacteria bacterium RIFCSPLOWO2_01_FULL_43_11b]|uniref:Solute-binding protein family 5 domain-containing protein n=1 Tax=Candidatus Gottesmanbacteria bacterium RIFCSPLOWO2_01_FULL_43_11b TaxID=1798392 RepID=A0A1F6AFT7_9BACT|nr:MAG: hypothetical protein A3A79_00145 [Candidatus Gottesmanbacteria bacterium RIFCSPLOWO2_01_FULL_43_11b]